MSVGVEVSFFIELWENNLKNAYIKKSFRTVVLSDICEYLERRQERGMIICVRVIKRAPVGAQSFSRLENNIAFLGDKP